MIQTDAEIDFMLQDAGENTLATCGTASVYGIFRRTTQLEQPGNDSVTTEMPTLLIRRGTLPDLAVEAEIAINGERFLVRDFRPDARSSEKLTRVFLASGGV